MNNAIPSDWLVMIAQKRIKNYGEEDGIWKFGIAPEDFIKDNPSMSLVQVNSGMANIDGHTYLVSDPMVGFEHCVGRLV